MSIISMHPAVKLKIGKLWVGGSLKPISTDLLDGTYCALTGSLNNSRIAE